MNEIKELSDIADRVTARPDGFLEDKYTGLLYQKISGTEVMPLVSPQNGAYLIPNGDGTFKTDYDSTTYFLGKSGNVIPQIDPYSRGELDVVDGKLISRYTGAEFTYDAERETYIPHYIPDDSLESAHIEGDYLVGNETGRRFLIDTDGTILTPKEEFIKEIQRQQMENFKKMEEDGTFEDWFSKRSRIPTEKIEKTPLELYLENIKSHPENVTEEDLNNLATLMEKGELPEETMKELEEKFGKKAPIETSLGEFLSNITNEQELCDYLASIGLNPTMISQIHHLDNNLFGNIFNIDKTAAITLHDKGVCISISISTTPNQQQSTEIKIFKDNKLSINRQFHDPLLVGDIRPGKSQNISAKLNEDGSLVVLEDEYQLQLHSKEDLSFHAKASRQESLILPDGTIQSGNKKEANTLCSLSATGLEPLTNISDSLQLDEAYKEMTKLKSLGFSERYFKKLKIAGLSYDLDGNETYLENENQIVEEIKNQNQK